MINQNGIGRFLCLQKKEKRKTSPFMDPSQLLTLLGDHISHKDSLQPTCEICLESFVHITLFLWPLSIGGQDEKMGAWIYISRRRIKRFGILKLLEYATTYPSPINYYYYYYFFEGISAWNTVLYG